MPETFNVAMIGLGFGAEFIPIYQALENVQVGAICRRNKTEIDKVGDLFGIDKRYISYDDVLADGDIDFVHINSPIGDHAWMTLKALESIRPELSESEYDEAFERGSSTSFDSAVNVLLGRTSAPTAS